MSNGSLIEIQEQKVRGLLLRARRALPHENRQSLSHFGYCCCAIPSLYIVCTMEARNCLGPSVCPTLHTGVSSLRNFSGAGTRDLQVLGFLAKTPKIHPMES